MTPSLFTRDHLITTFQANKRSVKIVRNEDFEIMQKFRYSLNIRLKKTPVRGYEAILGIDLTRRKPIDDKSLKNHTWNYKRVETRLADDFFDKRKYLTLDRQNKRWALLPFAILGLKSIYDQLRKSNCEGILYRSEFFRLQDAGIIPHTAPEFSKIVSDIVNSSKYRWPGNERLLQTGEAKRNLRIQQLQLMRQFLIDGNEMYNLICWQGNHKRAIREEQVDENMHVLNILPEDITISNHLGARFNDNDLEKILEWLFFPSGTLLSEEEHTDYASKVSDGESLSFHYPSKEPKNYESLDSKLGVINRVFKESYVAPMRLLFDPEEEESIHTRISLVELHDYVDNKFAQRPQELPQKGDETPLTSRQVNVLKIVERGLYKDLILRYYDLRNSELADSLFKFSLCGSPVTVPFLMISDLNNLMFGRTLNNDSFVYSPEELPQMSLPRNAVMKQIGSIYEDNAYLYNDPTYRLIRVNQRNGSHQIVFADASFFHHKFTMGLLNEEMNSALIGVDFDVQKVLLNSDEQLPLRKELLPTASSLTSELKNRICAGGPAIMLAIALPAPEKGFSIIVQQRSARVTEQAFMRSIAPEGFHQPISNHVLEVNIYWTILREMFEEVCQDGNEIRFNQGFTHDYYIKDNPAVAWLHDNPNSWEMLSLGIGINPMFGNYSCGVLWVIHDPTFYLKYSSALRPGWEFRGRALLNSMDKALIYKQLQHADWSPQGYTWFVRGLMKLKKMYSESVNIPELS